MPTQLLEIKTLLLGDADAVGSETCAVTWTRWRSEVGRLPSSVGVYWRPSEAVTDVLAELDGVPFVALQFPTATDGRAYSQAQRLRRLGYRGPLRAIGWVKRDQALFMVRCGFDELEIADDAAAIHQAIQGFTAVYQPAADARSLIR